MKKYLILLIALLFATFTLTAQTKNVTEKLQVTSLKNAELLKTDAKGNVLKGDFSSVEEKINATKTELLRKINTIETQLSSKATNADLQAKITEVKNLIRQKVNSSDFESYKTTVQEKIAELQNKMRGLENLPQAVQTLSNSLTTEVQRLEGLIANAGKVKTVNGVAPDEQGNIEIKLSHRTAKEICEEALEVDYVKVVEAEYLIDKAKPIAMSDQIYYVYPSNPKFFFTKDLRVNYTEEELETVKLVLEYIPASNSKRTMTVFVLTKFFIKGSSPFTFRNRFELQKGENYMGRSRSDYVEFYRNYNTERADFNVDNFLHNYAEYHPDCLYFNKDDVISGGTIRYKVYLKRSHLGKSICDKIADLKRLIDNAVKIESIDGAPSPRSGYFYPTITPGTIIYDSSDNILKCWNGKEWKNLYQ